MIWLLFRLYWFGSRVLVETVELSNNVKCQEVFCAWGAVQ